MKRVLAVVFLLCIVIGSLSAVSWYSTKTLPAGVWKTDLYWKSYNITKGGVNPSGDQETWFRKDLSDFQKEFGIDSKKQNPRTA